jgi:hypothetical protein
MVTTVLALAGCASEHYGHARETRFDRPYQGGAANVPDEPSRSTSTCSSPDRAVGELALLLVYAAAAVTRSPVYVKLAPQTPPPPPPGR